jgi:hypothetical protein
VWDELTFDEVQSIFHNWMSCLARVIENGGESILESIQNGFLVCSESQNQRGRRKLSRPPVEIGDCVCFCSINVRFRFNNYLFNFLSTESWSGCRLAENVHIIVSQEEWIIIKRPLWSLFANLISCPRLFGKETILRIGSSQSYKGSLGITILAV